jgi:hypothetical protein
MQKPLKKREEFFCSTQNEALDLIDARMDGEDGDKITLQTIDQKSNKNGSYYRVVIGYSYNTPAGIMETELEGIDENESEEA